MKKLWAAFAVVTLGSFAVLGWIGVEIYRNKPPIPIEIVDASGAAVFEKDAVSTGQNVWQKLGGMQVGSIWGHGAYTAPDWTADWLHRELVFVLDGWAKAAGAASYEALPQPEQAALRARLTELYRNNSYDPRDGRLVLPLERAKAVRANAAHFSDVFEKGRAAYAIPAGAVANPVDADRLSAFFFWSAWAAAAHRPGTAHSYTNDWPHEPLIGNVPTPAAILWTGVSVFLLLAGIGAMVWFYARPGAEAEEHATPPTADPLLGLKLSGSQKATFAYFGVACALMLVQVLAGIVTAHYGVEGDGFYGVPLANWLPYVVTRTWHVQLGLFWIATSWLAAGLFLAPLILGREPKGQTFGVLALLGALVVVVVGSLGGEWMSVFHKFGDSSWFLWGHQGYEYVELGRVWQIGLFAGLLLWLGLVARGVLPPLLERRPGASKLLGLFTVAAVAIAGFYGAGLTWGQHTHISVVEYWRWWVVHLWVEGFFEVFATVVIAFLFSKMGLIRDGAAARATLAASVLFLSGGIVGTAHHLYFSGTPTSALAFGSVFSALEVVPLTLMGYEAWHHLRVEGAAPWVRSYKWPIRFFVAVAFWNLVGAGLFGFMINPPAALYYMQGLNTTPLHGHAALFGVYGMLGIGLMLFCLRAADAGRPWKDGLLRVGFWGLNGGLMAMCLLSLLPQGLMQTIASIEHGYWFARSADFLQTPLMSTLRWMRVPGDVVFATGIGAVVLFVAGLLGGWSYARPTTLTPLKNKRSPEPALR
ncbi:MAG: nitric oxide reductase large subunit [Elusimicrobia bacterium CG1_02_63_36]|nr:MAG: nitric oxide reductase large subunit [Elusimicrobia bacterium CG1_02_63_36]PIP83605.1 MAG: nitric oxide reductase large subunit [Elusimicrobia bacterium CG22_combo_CG10-13_8_21_14_all_63_91]PJA13183.1 MAG: nitric oxide reductase large subunit [Elusimicrobia bacterium CG_4_10_14_0_2_um_filter_63_34]PJB26097.1 MAG: nitric oxide reductase large subunit [Elusimicrobia bacterium CG_4_9_14_3_um_filter_62_55]